MPRTFNKVAVFGALLCFCALPSPAQTPPGTAPTAAAPPAAAPTTSRPATPGTTPPAATAPEPPHDHLDSVAAIVNDDVVTEYDLQQRILLFISTSGLPRTTETIAKLREQILTQLETEQLQIQEARRKGITVSPVEVDKQIDRITGDNHMSREQLAELLRNSGVNMATLRAQIATQIAWQKAVQDEYSDRINITPEDVDAELARLAEGADKPHFLLSVIFMAVDNPDNDAKVLKNMQDIRAQLQAGANFGQVARQFSQSPTAAAGGDMGWVHQGQLPTELDSVLVQLQTGSVTDPVRSTGGYYILGVRDRQEGIHTVVPDPATQKPTGPLTVARLLLPVGPNPGKQLLENVMKIAEQIHANVNGCDVLPKLAEQVHGMVYQDLAKMGLKITDLDANIQAAIAKAGPGETTPPFRSPAGVEMMVRCDKRAPTISKFQLPSRQQVEEQLFDQQITMLSRRYLRDLRRSANVETK